MATINYTQGTLQDQQLQELGSNIEVFDKLSDVTAVLSKLEDGQLVATKDGTTSYDEVYQLITSKITELENNYATQLATAVEEITAAAGLDETVLYEASNTYTTVPAGTTLNDSVLNYNKIRFYCRRTASAAANYVTDFEASYNTMYNCISGSTATSNARMLMIPGYGSEYRQLTFDATGSVITAIAGSECIYKIVGIGARS